MDLHRSSTQMVSMLVNAKKNGVSNIQRSKIYDNHCKMDASRGCDKLDAYLPNGLLYKKINNENKVKENILFNIPNIQLI